MTKMEKLNKTFCGILRAGLFAFLFVFAVAASAQETTGGLEGTIKDPTGATIGGASVVLTGTSLIGEKKVTTDHTGYYRYTNLPPGTYTLTIIASGFSEQKRENIQISTGRLPSIDVTLTVGSDKTVVEVSEVTPQIDVTDSRSQTIVSKDEIDYDPRGRSFQSVIQYAPGARVEPLQANGYSIDGATSSENTYLIDGMATNALDSGQSKANLPFEFIQEVQVKTSGFQAEYGGALGGVVTAVVRKGSNMWHGEGLVYYEGDPMDASPAAYSRFNPAITTSTTSCARCDIPLQYYTPVKDHYRQVQPGFVFAGPILRDKLWISGAIEPYFTSLRRIVNYNFTNALFSVTGPRPFTQDTQQYFGFVRSDYALTQKIRLFGSYMYQYYRASGTSLPSADSLAGLTNTSVTSNPDTYNHGIGNVQPNSATTAGADITISSALVATLRYGHFYNNYQDRGVPTGVRYLFSATGTNAKNIDGTQNSATAGTTPLAQASGFNNIGANTQYTALQNVVDQYNADLAYYKKGFFGQHNFKFGYQLNHNYYNTSSLYNTALVQVYPGTTYTPLVANQPNCAAIEATNLTRYGKVDNQGNTTIDPSKCMGDDGYLIVRDYSNGIGSVSENNQAFYVQDAWTIGHGITAQLGLRLEKELVPSFNLYPSGINFGWGGKVAPRLGAAWDVFQNGKMKVFGSYGVFNDVFKLNLAIGSFGGNYWHNCVYALDDQNYANTIPVRQSNGHYCSGTGNANLSGGVIPSDLRFIENQDYRIAANDPANPVKPGVDPNLKSFRQHEAVFGIDYQISKGWALESRWSRRRVDHAIEDTGIQTANGEAFPISNPGEGIDFQPVPNCPGCGNQPRAARAYDAVEFRLTKTASAHWFAQLDYTYSRLRGNYSGLVDSDVADGNATTAAGIRSTSPNNGRAFDEPYFQYTANGTPFNGLLATDRPNTFKGIAYYRLPWAHRFETSLGVFQALYSGTPLSSYVDVAGGGSYEVYPEGRAMWVPATADSNGNVTFGAPQLKRTPFFVQTDLSFVQAYRVSQTHEAWRIGFEANFTNVFNFKRPVIYGTKLDSANRSSYIKPPGYNAPSAGEPTISGGINYAVLESSYDWKGLFNSNGLTLNSQYGQPTAFQTPRQIRLKLDFKF